MISRTATRIITCVNIHLNGQTTIHLAQQQWHWKRFILDNKLGKQMKRSIKNREQFIYRKCWLFNWKYSNSKREKLARRSSKNALNQQQESVTRSMLSKGYQSVKRRVPYISILSIIRKKYINWTLMFQVNQVNSGRILVHSWIFYGLKGCWWLGHNFSVLISRYFTVQITYFKRAAYNFAEWYPLFNCYSVNTIFH